MVSRQSSVGDVECAEPINFQDLTGIDDGDGGRFPDHGVARDLMARAEIRAPLDRRIDARAGKNDEPARHRLRRDGGLWQSQEFGRFTG